MKAFHSDPRIKEKYENYFSIGIVSIALMLLIVAHIAIKSSNGVRQSGVSTLHLQSGIEKEKLEKITHGINNTRFINPEPIIMGANIKSGAYPNPSWDEMTINEKNELNKYNKKHNFKIPSDIYLIKVEFVNESTINENKKLREDLGIGE